MKGTTIENLLTTKPEYKKHPKCKGTGSWDCEHGYDHDCGYDTILECDQCKYCLHPETGKPLGRKDPAAKCNSMENY